MIEKSEEKYRVIFEFESTEQVETLLEKIAVDIESGTLLITGTWSWGSESFSTFNQIEENENDEPNDN